MTALKGYPMNTDPLVSSILSAVRTVIAFGGGFVVARGWLTSDQLAQVGGLLATAIPLAFGIWSQIRNKQAVRDALALPAQRVS